MILAVLALLVAQPGEFVVTAAQDMGTLPGEVRPHVRYLAISGKNTVSDAKVLSGHINGLSREPDIVPPALVGSNVLRINLKDYGWSAAVFEKLANSDPYYHVDITKDGHKIRALAPIMAYGWSDRKDGKHEVATNLKYLIEQTGSKTPILRADWFFNQTAAQFDRDPGYYDFLGIKDEKSFQKLIGFDEALAKDFKKVLRESVAISSVTLQPRAIERQQSQGGAYWKTYDFRKAVNKKNPLRILGEDIEKQADASEQYALLPNGMWATFLGNAKGERQDAAPDFIASDRHSKSRDKKVHINVSCVRCHKQGGLQPIDGFVRGLNEPPLAVTSPDYEKFRQLRREYLKSMETQMELDKSLYTQAVKEATGWDTKTYAEKYAEYWERYEDAQIDLVWAAADLYTTPAILKAVLLKRIQQGNTNPETGGVDFVLARLAQGKLVEIRQYEEVHALALTILRGELP